MKAKPIVKENVYATVVDKILARPPATPLPAIQVPVTTLRGSPNYPTPKKSQSVLQTSIVTTAKKNPFAASAMSKIAGSPPKTEKKVTIVLPPKY